MAHFYLDESLEPVNPGEVLVVAGDEAHHAVKVARLAVGEEILLGNGRGMQVRCETIATAPREFSARALEDARVEDAPTTRIHLAQALAKGGRDEMAVQAAVEIGIDGIVPWQGRRSISQWRGDKIAKQRERWQQIAREATKQSMRAHLPQVAELSDAAALGGVVAGAQVLVLDPVGEQALSEVPLLGNDLVLVVGPEGGIDPREFDQLVEAGATRVRLGSNVLRTSTAGPAALAVLQARLGRW